MLPFTAVSASDFVTFWTNQTVVMLWTDSFRLSPGFRMMELFGLVEDRYSSVSGVSMVPGTFNTFPCFHLHSDALLAQPTRCAHIFTSLLSDKNSKMLKWNFFTDRIEIKVCISHGCIKGALYKISVTPACQPHLSFFLTPPLLGSSLLRRGQSLTSG